MSRLPPLTALPAFEATARLGSVRAAAEELGRTHGAVSKQLHRLADDLGVALFEKRGTGLRLTPEGEQFQATASRALGTLARTADDLRSQADDRIVRLDVSTTLAARWLVPRLPRFQARCPDIELQLRIAATGTLAVPGWDLSLSWDRLAWDLDERDDCIVLGDVAFALATAPGYPLFRAGEGYSVDARLLRENFVHTWDVWERMSGRRVSARRTVTFPQTGVVIEAAAAGLGAALVEQRLVADELRDGRLVAPFGFTKVPGGFAAIVPSRSRGRPAVTALLDWLAAEVTG